MATLARLNLVIQNEAGDIQDGCSVQVRRESDNGLASCFSDRAGTISLGNPFTAADGGNAGFHVTGDSYKITASKAGFSRTWRYVAIGTAAELDIEDVQGLPLAYLDTDGTLAANSDTKVPSQKAIVTYVAAAIAALRNGVAAAFDTLAEIAAELALKATIASPTFTGNPAAPTQSQADNSTKLATTAYVRAAITAVLNGVASAFDTLVEIAAALARTAYLDVEDQILTGGARVTSKDLGTITTGTVTPDPGDRPLQHYTANGAHTLAPGAVVGSYMLDIVNGASAGAITTSGWTKVVGAFTTTNGHKFRCHCSVGQGGSLLIIQALQ